MKKILLLLLCILSFNAIHADVTWNLSDDGTLTISGTGEMANYSSEYNGEYNEYFCDTPWFDQQDKIKNVVIENGVTSIGESAFYACSSIISVTIPNSVTSIGDCAFIGCSSLTSVTIPNSVTSIGSLAFAGCFFLADKFVNNSNCYCKYDVVDIEQNDGLLIKGNEVVNCRKWATVVTIPNSVTSIGGYAFSGCSKLTSINIPNSVTSIGGPAFEGTKWYDNQPDGLVYIGKVLYKYKGHMTSNTKIEIKEGTTEITDSAFKDCSGLTSVAIPNSVTSIGKYTFSGCSGLTSVTIPNSVTSIGSSAFSGCSGLTSVAIPNSVTSIEEYTFWWCTGLTYVNIGNSVTHIGTYAFGGCTGLTYITCTASTPPYLALGRGLGIPFDSSIPFYVPDTYFGVYKLTYDQAWSDPYIERPNIQAIPTTYTLTDGETFNNGLLLDECEISYTRTFNNTAWQALYIPFSLNYNDWKDNFEVAYINNLRQLDTDDDGVIDKTIMDVVKIKDGSLIPNTPYLIKAKSVGEKTLSINNATLYETKENSIDCRTTIAEYTFTGTYNAISASTLIANNYYTMGGGALIMTDGNSGLKPYRWYMKIEARSPMYNVSNAAKAITINVVGEEETTTGVENLRMINYKSPVYDLNGRKVNENNLKPGIYVKNGKKFVVK